MNNDNLEALAIKLKEERISMGLSQKDLAAITGLTTRAIQNYETNAQKPSLLTITAISNAFDVSVDYLLGRTNNRMSHKVNQLPEDSLSVHDNLLPEIIAEQASLKAAMAKLDKKIGKLKKLR